jgi:hemoglobin/transferrin/lactoferrin receptor protein
MRAFRGTQMKRIIGSFLFGLFAPLADAQTDARDDEATQLDPIQVTAGRVEEGQFDVPQPITVVDRDQIERAAPQVMTDLLRGQTGVFTQSSGPGQGIAIIRGLKGSEVLHLVDGMRLNNSLFRNSPSQYIALLDPYNIDQIEVLRGPAATLYGSDAMGGVLQVLTPERRFTSDGWDASGGGLLQYGSADLSRIGRVHGATGRRDLSIGGGFTWAQYGQRDIADGGRQPFTDYRSRAGDAKVLWSPATGHELMFSFQHFELPKLPRYHEIVGGPGGAGSGTDLPIFFEPNRRVFAHARYRMSAPLPAVSSLEVHLGQQIVDDDRNRLVNPTTREEEANRSRLSGITVQAVSPVLPSLRLVYGTEFYRDDIDSAKQRRNLDTDALSTRAPTFPDGAQQDSVGVFVSGEWAPVRIWKLDTGVRYSRVATDLPATSLSNAAKIDDSDFTGHLGSRLALTDALAWTVNLGRGFRAPDVFDLGTLGPRAGTDPQQINVPNTQLEPETILSADTGFKWLSRNWSAESSFFYSRYKNRIEPREKTGNTIQNGELGCTGTEANEDCIEVQSRNISRAKYWGAELGARWHQGSFETYGTLNWTMGEEERGINAKTPANRVPPLNGQVGVVFGRGKSWFAESYVLFAARQNRLDDDDRGDVRIDPDGTAGWATLNVRGGWNPWSPLHLQLAVNNLLDHAYREHGSGIDAPGIGAVATARVDF